MRGSNQPRTRGSPRLKAMLLKDHPLLACMSDQESLNIIRLEPARLWPSKQSLGQGKGGQRIMKDLAADLSGVEQVDLAVDDCGHVATVWIFEEAAFPHDPLLHDPTGFVVR